MNINTKMLFVIAGLVATIAAAVALWQNGKAKEDAAWERATVPRDSAPSSKKPITSDDLFSSGNGEGER
ncbi:hypothetical protein H9C73_08865 [Marinobacterium sp. AK62]|uniref:Uncharacterized protein n=1 Tax=Marinobacterium alkalitolerans TaxID=1542925 RepID=A0ABS3ZAW6_9GAMM|nr:hypothetical protein [Marinobacterium alkalitolerans]MBP0048847.1 hypothetical protein [Marinobacterium alkalitolerans]